MAISKAQDAYRKWHQKHKDAYNERRREKYANDPEAKLKALEKSREYRRNNQTNDGRHYRKVGRSTVEVFRIGTVAEIIGRSVQVLRLWEKQGKIPAPSIKSAQRFYTQQQVHLLTEFAQLMDEVRYQPKIREVALEKKTNELKALWAGARK